MEKVALGILIALLIIYPVLGTMNSTITGETITGKVITGKATSADASISIFVKASPSIIIYSPLNGTYLTGKNLELNYSALSANEIWYNFDNSTNKTLSENFEFNTTDGKHILTIYANNSFGISSKSVVFYVNSSKLIIDYNEFSGPYSGNSTDFLKYTLEQLGNLNNVKMENTQYGEISFNQAINISESANAQKVVNISKDVKISHNYININSTALPGFNRSAVLSLSGLTFSNPEILMDGSLCPTTVCTEISYKSGTLRFYVTHFTSYSAEETPNPPSPPSSGGSISGGGGAAPASGTSSENETFQVNPSYLPVQVFSGESAKSYFIITNPGKTDIPVNITIENLSNLLNLSEYNFILGAGKSRVITMSALAGAYIKPGLYIGKIIVVSGGAKSTVLASVEVNSKQALFDVNINIPPAYRMVNPGDNVTGEITLYNLGGSGKIDVLLEYNIINGDGKVISSKNETVAVDTSLDIIRTMPIPKDAAPGSYVYYIKASYEGKTAISSSEFDVVKKAVNETEFIILASILAVILGLIISLIIKGSKIKKTSKKAESFSEFFEKIRGI